MMGMIRGREWSSLLEACKSKADEANNRLTKIRVREYEILYDLNTKPDLSGFERERLTEENVSLERDEKIAEQEFHYWEQKPIMVQAERLGIEIPEVMFEEHIKWVPGRVLLPQNVSWLQRRVMDSRLSRWKDIAAIITPILSLMVAILSLALALRKKDPLIIKTEPALRESAPSPSQNPAQSNP